MKRSVWIEKGLRSYSVRFYENNKKMREWCPDFITAQRRLIEIKQRLLAKSQGLGDIGAKPSEIFEQYINFLSLSHRKGTIRIKRYSIGPFLKTVPRLGDITSNRIRRFRDESLKIHAPTTVAIEMRDLRAFLNWCVREGFIAESPFKDISIPASAERGRKLELEELQRIIQASNPVFRPFLMVLVYTGCRRGEALLMKWEDLDKGIWTIPPENTKTKMGRVVPLDPIVLRLLGKPGKGLVFPKITLAALRWHFNKALRDAKVEGKITPHDLRHTFASHWKGQTIPLMAIMGWKSMKMVQRYTHLEAQSLKQEISSHGIGADLGRNDVTYPKKRQI